MWLSNADQLAFLDSSDAGHGGFPSPSRKDVQPIIRAATLLFIEGHLRGNAEALAAISDQPFRWLLDKTVDNLEISRK